MNRPGAGLIRGNRGRAIDPRSDGYFYYSFVVLVLASLVLFSVAAILISIVDIDKLPFDSVYATQVLPILSEDFRRASAAAGDMFAIRFVVGFLILVIMVVVLDIFSVLIILPCTINWRSSDGERLPWRIFVYIFVGWAVTTIFPLLTPLPFGKTANPRVPANSVGIAIIALGFCGSHLAVVLAVSFAVIGLRSKIKRYMAQQVQAER